jgi:hypothetical protein
MNLQHCADLRSHITYLRYEGFIVVMLKIQATWDVELCGLVVTTFERIVVLSKASRSPRRVNFLDCLTLKSKRCDILKCPELFT